MTLYHGSLDIVNDPRILESNRQLDFGSGLYTTTSPLQAERWTRARMVQAGSSSGYINMYDYVVDKLATRR